MKKVLLTTTALVMTAGFAAAEVTISGASQVSVSATGTGDNVVNTHVDMNFALSAESDTGVTMATTIGYDGGNQVDLADYHLDGVEADDAADNGAWTNTPSIVIGYAGYTATLDSSGVADLYNGDKNTGELGVSGSLGDVDFAVTTNVGGTTDKSSYSLKYAMGDLTATLVGSDNADGQAGTDATKLTLAYKMGDTTFTAASDDKEKDASGNLIETVTSLGVTSKLSDTITVSYTAKNTETLNSNVGDHWDASITYSAGAMTSSFSLDEADVTKLKATYDLGGGATLFALMKSSKTASEDFQAVGINFAF
jgi:outer membrane protein OmpU